MQEASGTILLQIGDVVDRGPGTMEAWTCLESLQKVDYYWLLYTCSDKYPHKFMSFALYAYMSSHIFGYQ